MNIATGVVIASDEVDVVDAVSIGTKILRKMDNLCLAEITLKRNDQAKTFATMRKAVKCGGK